MMRMHGSRAKAMSTVCLLSPQGVLALNVPIPGLRRHVLLTKTLEWNLYW